MNIWQIAAGDGSRDYSEAFLKYGVILIGPGNDGDYFSNRQIYDNPSHPSYRDFFPSFAEVLKQDDLVILKRPCGDKWEFISVGKVESDYLYMELFDDVDGWDLQHARKIRWKKPPTQTLITGLRRGTFCGVNNNIPIEKAMEIWEQGKEIQAEELPPPAGKIDDEELIDLLIEHGLSGNNSEIITKTIWRLRRLGKWYSIHGSDIGEHEIRTFLIIPLLVALGWPEQKIKIEWNNIDVAIFERTYLRDARPVIIIESKRFGDGLRYAPEQIKKYARDYPECESLVVSDGIRYKLFERIDEEWQYVAYMNLLWPRNRHPYFKEVKGAEELFLRILPK